MIWYNQVSNKDARAIRLAGRMSQRSKPVTTSSIPPTKVCTKCGQEKPFSDFHRQAKAPNGLRSHCKECRKSDTRQYYENNKERVLSTNADWRMRYPQKMRQYQKTYEERYPERVNNSKRRYAQLHARELVAKAMQYRKEHPDKYKAHVAVQVAVGKGLLPKIGTQLCENCGNVAQNYHHWSYEREHWLDVIPLCCKCHNGIHNK